MGLVEMLEESNFNEDDSDLVCSLKKASESLLKVVNDVVDFGKMKFHELPIDSLPFKINDLLEDLSKIYEPMTKNRNTNLQFSCWNDVKEETFSGDPFRAKQVIQNLFSNAIKFTEAGEIRVPISGEHLCSSPGRKIRVEDTGAGMSKREQANIFNAYEQVGKIHKGGTSLGLAICYQIITQMEGNISVESTKSSGTTLTVNIPAHYKTELRGTA